MSTDLRDRHPMANRNSTPEASTSSNLRPPSSRPNMATGHHLRASADMGGQSNASSHGQNIRPASEVYYNQHHQGQGRGGQDESNDQAAQRWLVEIDNYEKTLEEMAAATLDQDFKDELGAIEQWFRVLSEPERTAALYALLQQATQVQTRFFIGVLQEMAKNQPVSGVLSPANLDPMANRLSSAMNRLSVEGSRSSFAGGRAPPSPSAKRTSGLDQAEINARFPEAANAIEAQRNEFRQRTGTEPRSNRSSAAIGDRSSLVAPSHSGLSDESRKSLAQAPPWGRGPSESQNTNARPKSSSGQQPMGHFGQQQASATTPRSARPVPISSDSNVQQTTLNAADPNASGMPMLSPYTGSQNWGSMMNTPMVPNFPNQDHNQANMVAQATAMKLAALGTANGRVNLSDPRDAQRERKARSAERQGGPPLQSPNQFGTNLPSNFVMTNEHGQVLNPQQAAAAIQAQQANAMNGQRSRPSSPGLTVPGQGIAGMSMPMNANAGLLSAYSAGNQAGLLNGAQGFGMGQFGVGTGENFHGDGSEIPRGRSPRGKRGSSRPPEDHADLDLLDDLPAWLRSLRLHKYTDELKKFNWKELVRLDDKQLEKEGVSAMGARNKLLKTFNEIKEKQSQGKLPT